MMLLLIKDLNYKKYLFKDVANNIGKNLIHNYGKVIMSMFFNMIYVLL